MKLSLPVKQGVFLLLFALVYANTLKHEFVLDDVIVITGNKFTKKGFAGIGDIMTHDAFVGAYGEALELTGGRYRPLSIVTFAVEHAFFGSNPFVGHLGNMVLFALTGLMIFVVLMRILPEDNGNWIPFLVAALFIVHPIHTEVVANIKSRDEIMALLFLLITLLLSLKRLPVFTYLLAPLAYFLALLSKENAITFLAIFPLTWYLFQQKSLKKIARAMVPYLVIAGVYLWMRATYAGMVGDRVTADIMDDPYLGASFLEKYATITYTIGKYLSLMIFPYPLSSDYSFNQIPLMSWSNLKVIGSLLLTIGMIVLPIWKLKEQPLLALGITIFFASFSVVSNMFFNVGTSMAERFVYIPSLGIIIAIVSLVYPYIHKVKDGRHSIPRGMALPLIIVLSLASVATWERNKAWKSNYTLYAADALTVPNSARIHLYFGIELISEFNKTKDRATLQKAIAEISESARINPKFHHAHYNLAVAHEKAEDYDAAIVSYNNVLLVQPQHIKTNLNLGLLYGRIKNDLDKSIFYFSKLRNSSYRRVDLYDNLGIAYGMKGDLQRAKAILLEGIHYNPNAGKLYFNLGITCDNMGDRELAQQYYATAFKLNPALKRN